MGSRYTHRRPLVRRRRRSSPRCPAVAHPPGRHIPVGDTQLWIEEEGAGEPVLLLAGGPASSHVVFHPVFSLLAESHRVIYLDYRGRGRSAPVEDPRAITFAAMSPTWPI